MLNQQHGALCCLGPSPRGGILNGYSPVNPVCGSGVKGLPSQATERLFKSVQGVNFTWVALYPRQNN